ncbi:uncharacterized protein LOC128238916 isoform X2 [Mya arenaria]|uniref:uncharacterized protein LOC128238916 isoform X2 n=1 Tax=Mya arenaria TaxID=6604 RepID=UPI0022E92DC4|nr:uncharacterized protein LOC128238916 isoform X2 [Mya arenaria]
MYWLSSYKVVKNNMVVAKYMYVYVNGTVCALRHPELKVDELLNGDVVIQVIPESDSEAERRAVFDLDTIELDKGSQSTGKEFPNRTQSSSNQQVKTSLQEKVQTAQLEWFQGQNKKVELEMELLREKIATSREKRKLFKALQTELKGKDDMDIIPLVCDE